jgi:hypothetical protein
MSQKKLTLPSGTFIDVLELPPNLQKNLQDALNNFFQLMDKEES